ncbi:hypothetical protein [Streptomyces sp. RTd22]|uniref:hypothetical protein n=1 Tax=Streptomyces sp. RTd22 TaxID=1841249 RepID=UPI0007C5CDEA|nr:hypothetical protein [Streptomyces sp. RTd22]
MPARPSIPVIDTPEHHFAAMLLVILTRSPDNAALRAAASLADNAAIASWALRPDHLVALTVEQYRQLLDYAAAPQVLDLALYLGGDRRQLRTLMDQIAREIAELLTHYARPSMQG